MSILQNAIDSIELGVEDHKSNDPKRLLSAVRNFYAGILLLFKHKLALLSKDDDEALIKQRILPVEEDGKIVWKGKGKKTVDFQQIQERFESLKIKVDWKRLKKAQDYRNNIEHYYDKDKTKPEVVQQYISGCFIIICDFIRTQLNEDPKGLFESETWDSLIQENEVHLADKRACCGAMEKLEWISDVNLRMFDEFICTECGSDLIEPIDDDSTEAAEKSFQCRICDEEWIYNDLFQLSCENESIGDHGSIADGGDPTFAYCPECSEEYYHTIDCVCVNCGAEGPYHCLRCGMQIPYEELSVDDGGMCGYCHHMTSKDD